MKKNSSFVNIEKKTYHLHFKDGIIELLFACIFIIYVINSSFTELNIERPLIIRFLLIPVTLILVLIKQFITSPRLGHVSFSKDRKKKQKWVLYFAIAAQLIALIAYILSAKGIIQTEHKSRILPLLIEFIFFILFFSLIYYYTSYPTFFFAGLTFAFGVPFTIFLLPWIYTRNYGYGLMAISGIIFLILGIYKLIRFLRNYPKSDINES